MSVQPRAFAESREDTSKSVRAACVWLAPLAISSTNRVSFGVSTAEMIYRGFCRLHHVFLERFAFKPELVMLIIRGAVDYFLAYGSVRATYGDILQRTAKAATACPFKWVSTTIES